MNILRQYVCMVVYLIMVENVCFPLELHDGGPVLRLNDGSLLSLFQMAGTWPSLFCLAYRGAVCGFLMF